MSDPSTVVDFTPIISAATPLVVTLLGGVFVYLINVGVNEIKKLTGIQIQQAAVDKLDAAAKSAAGAIVAAAADNASSTSFSVGNTEVAKVMNAILVNAPSLLSEAGISPAAFEQKILGEIGSLQATMTQVTPAKA